MTQPGLDEYALAQLTVTSEVKENIDAGEPPQFIAYQGESNINLSVQGTKKNPNPTAVVNLMEFHESEDTPGIFVPQNTNLQQIQVAIGLENGQLATCTVYVGDELDYTPSCAVVETYGSAVSDILYIQQVRQSQFPETV